MCKAQSLSLPALRLTAVSQGRSGVKRGSSFDTPAVKRRLFESPQTEDSLARQRSLGVLKDSLSSTEVPVFYRLDYLWGKTPEKQAKPGLTPDSHAEREARLKAESLQKVEERAKEAVTKLGMGGVALPLPKHKGRPAGSKNKVVSQPGLREKRADVTARNKLALMEELDALAVSKGSKRKAATEMQKRHKVSLSFARNLFKSSYRQRAEDFVSSRSVGKTSLRQKGSHLGFCHFVSKSQGKRLMRDGVELGRKDRLRSVWQETLLWSQLEEANLHILSLKDVLADFLDRLEVAIAVRKKDEEAGSLTEEGKAELAAMAQKQASLTDNAKQREKYTARLVTLCGLRARTCQQTANLSHEEETLRQPGDFSTSSSVRQLAPKSVRPCP